MESFPLLEVIMAVVIAIQSVVIAVKKFVTRDK